MQIIRDTSAITPEPCVATIGFFDGVHAGHRYLIQQVKEIAAAKGLRSVRGLCTLWKRNWHRSNSRQSVYQQYRNRERTQHSGELFPDPQTSS